MFRKLNNARISKPFSIILGIVLLINLLLPGITLADTSTTLIPDNFPKNHVEALKDYKEYKIEIKGEKFVDGNYGEGPLSVDVTWGNDGRTVSWNSNIPLAYVFVKGGEGGGGTLYTYNPPAKTDSNLGTGTNQQISHVTFYYNEPPEEPTPGSISGAKFNDKNGNGSWDEGEPGIKDWIIKLYRGGELLDSTKTDSDGKYSFGGLVAGTYKVYEEEKEGWIQKAPQSVYYTVELAGGKEITDKNFGNMEVKEEGPKPGTISGAKFNDKNGNGIWDEGELGIKDWIIKLYRGSELVDTETTDSEGKYAFPDLLPGTYKIYEEDRAGWKQTAPKDIYFTVELGADQNVGNKNFGNMQIPPTEEKPGSIAGAKYNDLDGDGSWDEDEPGIKDWTIKLYRDSQLIKTATTDVEGSYVFGDLAPGTYMVYEEDREGWKQISPKTIFFTVSLSEDDQITDLNFGNQRITPPVTPPVTPPTTPPVTPPVTPPTTPPTVPPTVPPTEDIKEGEPTAPPSKDSSPKIKITPDRVPAGDPIITLKPSEPLKAAYAILPHGKKIDLHFNAKKGEWKGFFLVPFGTPDGPYEIKIYTINRQNVTRQYNYTITIDNSIPLVTIKNVQENDGVLTFDAKVLLPASSVMAKVGDHEFKLTKVGDFNWTGSWKIPADLAGKYVVEVVAADEEGNTGTASFEMVINNKVALKEKLLSRESGQDNKDNSISDSVPIDVSFEATPRDSFNASVASALIPLAGLVAVAYRRKKAQK